MIRRLLVSSALFAALFVSVESYGPGKEIGKVPHRRRLGVSGADVGFSLPRKEIIMKRMASASR